MKTIIILVGLILMTTVITTAQIAQGGNYTLNQSVVAGGGGTSNDAGNTFKVEGTIGQAIAGTTSTNAPFSLKGGFWAAQPFAPTAAVASVGGRVVTSSGRGIRNVLITMTDASGATRATISSAFGRFNFGEVPSGATYIFSARAKRFTFNQPTQAFSITEDTNDIVFVGDPIGLQEQ